jgi:hypothetical protein
MSGRIEPAPAQEQPSTTQQVLDLILEQCRYWQGRDEARRGGFACLYAQAKEIVDNAAPIANAAPQPVAMVDANDDGMWADILPDVSVKVGQMLYADPIVQTGPQHSDDAAVDRFAAAMKAKLAKSRAKGRGGWDDPNVCSVEFLAQLLVEHLGKGNAGTFEDVANFAMMLHQRSADPKVLAEAAATQPKLVMPVTLWSVNADYDKGWADHAAEVRRLNAELLPSTPC